MWIESKPRNGKKETLFIFKFTSTDDLNVFIKVLQLYASTSSDQGIRQYMTKFASDIQKRCDDKFADSRAKLSATVFSDEIAMFTDCLNRICFEYEMARIRSLATNQMVLPEPEPAVDVSEYLKKEARYLEDLRLMTEALTIERNNAEQRKAYDNSIKNMISHNQIAFITEQGKQQPGYVVMSVEQYNQIISSQNIAK